MTKNQKIAIGCGAVGCLGLIVLLVAGGAGWYLWQRNLNANANDESYSESETANNNTNNSNRTRVETETKESASAERTTPESSENVSTTMSEDTKHRLFQAASASANQELMRRVMKRIGLFDASTEENERFMKEHIVWVFKNSAFLKEIDTPEKARAYVEANIND